MSLLYEMSQKALALGRRRTGDAEGRVELGLSARFEQERNDNDALRTGLVAPECGLGPPERPDGRMEDRLELLAGGRVGKDAPGQLEAAQAAIRRQKPGAEYSKHLLERRLARFDDPAGQLIRVHHGHPAGAQQLGGSRLAHPQAASQAKDFHEE